jgi:hypothetical protein
MQTIMYAGVDGEAPEMHGSKPWLVKAPVDAKAGGARDERVAVVWAANTRRVAQVVGNHDRRVKTLEVEYGNGVVVEAALRLHDKRQRLHGWLCTDLLSGWGDLHKKHGHGKDKRRARGGGRGTRRAVVGGGLRASNSTVFEMGRWANPRLEPGGRDTRRGKQRVAPEGSFACGQVGRAWTRRGIGFRVRSHCTSRCQMSLQARLCG